MEKFKTLWLAFKKFIKAAIPLRKYLSVDDMVKNLVEQCGINKYKAQSACEIIMAAMSACMRLRSKKMNPMFGTKTFGGGQVKYFFNVTVNSFFGRTEQLVRKIFEGTCENQFYLTDVNNSVAKEYSATLGILEAMGALSFNMTGGANSQIFIHIGQIGNLKKIFWIKAFGIATGYLMPLLNVIKFPLKCLRTFTKEILQVLKFGICWKIILSANFRRIYLTTLFKNFLGYLF